MSTSGGSGGGGLSVVTAHVTAAQISTLFSAPVEIIAAPGADRFTVVPTVAYEVVAGNSTWDSSNVGVYYDGDVSSGEEINEALGSFEMFSNSAPVDQVGNASKATLVAWDIAMVGAQAVVLATFDPDPVRSAPIATASIGASGAGYAPGDTGTIDDATFGTPTGYVVDTVGALGVVTAFHLALSTAGYDPAGSPFSTTAGGAQAGIGTGLTVNVLTLAAATGDLYVTAFYHTITTH